MSESTLTINIKLTRNGAPIKQEGTKKNLKHIPCNRVSSQLPNGTYCWSKHRVCPFQSECWYSHSQKEFEENLYAKPCLERRPDGTCPRPHCRFNHNISVESVAVPAADKKLQPCRYLQPDGTCKFGVACKFSHDPSVADKYRSNWVSLGGGHSEYRNISSSFTIPSASTLPAFIVDMNEDTEMGIQEDEEEYEEGEIHESPHMVLFEQMLKQTISTFGTSSEDRLREIMSKYDDLSNVVEQLCQSTTQSTTELEEGEEVKERVIDLQFNNLSNDLVQCLLNVFHSLTKSKLNINVLECC